MKAVRLFFACVLALSLSSVADASLASDTQIDISGQTAGATPFISKLTLTVNNMSGLRRVQFSIAPKPGSVSRPLSATYSKAYLNSRGYLDAGAQQIIVPVFGLYAGYSNTVTLRYVFADGSARKVDTVIGTDPYDDSCHYGSPTVHQARSATTALSYDYILVTTSCSTNSPAVIDTDGALRWVGTSGAHNCPATFFDNAIYASKSGVVRNELDGAFTQITDLANLDAVGIHHSMDPGKYGLILDVHTKDWVSSVNVEIDPAGNVLKRWVLGDIIRQAMISGGDDPSVFVRTAKGQYNYFAFEDWFHNNSVAYRKSDDSLIVSSRENFVICLDYETSRIKWILGDTSKQWFRYPSLRRYALNLTPGSHAPFGQHTVSVTNDNHLLLFDNGRQSAHHRPFGYNRSYSAPRKYKLNLIDRTANEVWNFPNNQSLKSSFRSGVYEDAPSNYLVHYANAPQLPRILGLAASGEKVFDYSFPGKSFRSLPVHWEKLRFIKPVSSSTQASSAEEGSEAEE